ncbi:MAG: PIN domain-containing protein [Bacillota bacterium]
MRSESSPKGFLLDTTALVDSLRGQEETLALLDRLREKAPLAICPITAAEIYAGARDEELKKVDSFLSVLAFFPITAASSRMAGCWRQSYVRRGVTLNLSDALIAAVAVENGLTLVTKNRRHYPMAELQVIIH